MAHALFILGELTDQDVNWMVSAGTRTQIGAGTELIHEGQPAPALYILLDGALEVSAAAAQQRHLARLGKGEVVGEMSFVRVFAGSVNQGSDLYNSTRNNGEKIGQIFHMCGNVVLL